MNAPQRRWTCPHCGTEGWTSHTDTVDPSRSHDRPDGRRCRKVVDLRPWYSRTGMTLRRLRAEMPEWQWTAERTGLGWQYLGKNDSKRVVVYTVSKLIDEDEFATAWVVDDGTTSKDYATWWLQENAHR